MNIKLILRIYIKNQILKLMNHNFFVRHKFLLWLAFVAIFSFSCKDEDYAQKLGLQAKASFKVTKVQGKVNTYLLESTSSNAYRYQWDLGVNEGLKLGGATTEAHYLAKGTYNVKLYAHGEGGYDIATQTITVEQDDFTPTLENPIFKLLTAHPWKLDPNSLAPITVGTENNPAEYFGGGALAPCQLNDDYTFSFVNNAFVLRYNANGDTFNAGNLAPNYSCAQDRSYESAFTFSTTVVGVGIATVTMQGASPAKFIGVTDVSSNNYRIISINANEMVLRSGTTTETVHQIRFVKK
jgi:PKD repeat protein